MGYGYHGGEEVKYTKEKKNAISHVQCFWSSKELQFAYNETGNFSLYYLHRSYSPIRSDFRFQNYVCMDYILFTVLHDGSERDPYCKALNIDLCITVLKKQWKNIQANNLKHFGENHISNLSESNNL